MGKTFDADRGFTIVLIIEHSRAPPNHNPLHGRAFRPFHGFGTPSHRRRTGNGGETRCLASFGIKHRLRRVLHGCPQVRPPRSQHPVERDRWLTRGHSRRLEVATAAAWTMFGGSTDFLRVGKGLAVLIRGLYYRMWAPLGVHPFKGPSMTEPHKKM